MYGTYEIISIKNAKVGVSVYSYAFGSIEKNEKFAKIFKIHC